jgi:carbon monoxide dehydrogenase subunit G
MQVKIEKKFEVTEPVEKVWALLSDPTRVVASVPGAKITEKVDDRHYKGSISVKVGPAVTDYKGEVHILNMDPAAHQMEIEGKGQDVRGKGSASMKMTGALRPLPDGGTEVMTTSEVSVVGLLAQFGGRMINDVSNKIFEEFTRSFRAQLAETPDATTLPDPEHGQAPGVSGSSHEPTRGSGNDASPVEGSRHDKTRAAREPEPIKALPLMLSIIRDAFARFIRRILGRSAES